MKKKPLILITNDDGISARGIAALVEAASGLGQLVIIAPDKPQSGMGHAITVNHPLRLQKSQLFPDFEAYFCTGTPVDCVKLGIYEVLKRKPDLLLSGINHGANTSTNVLYSGTMSAAVEGAIENIPSIGFSLNNHDFDADFEGSKAVVRKLVSHVLQEKMPSNICYNVNIPDCPANELKGIKIARGARAFWEDRFDRRKDQFGRDYYWLTGNFENQDDGHDTDLRAISEGYASLVPIHYDMTAYQVIKDLKNIDL